MGSRFGRNSILLLVLAFLCCVGYTRDYIYTFKPTKPIQSVSEIYESSVWIHFVTLEDSFAGTGWAVAYDEDLGVTFISTAGHVVDHGVGVIRVLYWPRKGDWKITTGVVFHTADREHGDIAIIAIPVKLPTLPVATREEYHVNDEVVIAGVQTKVPPALISVGTIEKITTTKVYINAWSYRGHSGGPVIHRKTNKVIGFVTAFGSNDTANASYTECSNFRTVTDALHEAGIR
jgi:hypothetical protein